MIPIYRPGMETTANGGKHVSQKPVELPTLAEADAFISNSSGMGGTIAASWG